MRSVVRSLRQLRRFIWRHAESHPSTTRLIRQQNALIMFASPGVDLVRSMFSTAAADSIRGGPMVEYERRIASGELVDGDSFQVDTIQQL
uniref:Uncharacterized protein n=1 Tax=Setaria italica TaxID=4555 RepID=K3ZE69_SETIT